MNELTKITTMSSREIAELTNKRHDNVLSDCDKLNESYRNLTLPEISVGVYTHPNTGNQQHREYLLTKMQCFDLLTGYRVDLRIKVNRRWEELEKEKQFGGFQLPQSFSEALMLAAKQAEQIEQQQKQIAIQAPKVLFADAVSTSDRSVLVSELAKILKQNGVEIGQNRLFIWLRENGYLCSKGEYYNQPTQKAMELGLFELKKTSITKPDGTVLVTVTTKVKVSECIVESNSGGRGFARAVEKQCRLMGNTETYFIWFHQTSNKEVRIFSHSAAVQNLTFMPNGWLRLFPEFSSAVLGYLKKGGNAHDDAPDALTGAIENRGTNAVSDEMLLEDFW